MSHLRGDDGLVARTAWRLARRGGREPCSGRGLPVCGDDCGLEFGIGDYRQIPASVADSASVVGDWQRPRGGCLVGLDAASADLAINIQTGSRMGPQEKNLPGVGSLIWKRIERWNVATRPRLVVTRRVTPLGASRRSA
jgi:hypothetical protein